MYAVVKVKGHQFRVEPDALVQVPKLAAEVGEQVPLADVLLLGGGAEGEAESVTVGNPTVAGAQVLAEVVRHGRGPKIQALKFKRRKDYRRHWGHRQDFTELRIQSIQAG
jgi:large subunit ribosomal protein L21